MGLTVFLQQKSLDIIQGTELVQDTQEQLKELCEGVDDWHKIWFELAVDIANEVGTEKTNIPRRCCRQKRSNIEAESPEVYYRRSLTVPFINHLLTELEERFSSNARIATLGLCLIPSVIVKKDDWKKNAENLVSLYQIDLPAPMLLQTELYSWRHKYAHFQQHQLPDSPKTTLNWCDDRVFPNVLTLIKLVCTIPVTSCEAERTFSTVRRIKPFLRATITESRLNGLALLHVHREISTDLDEAVDRFARRHSRKLQLLYSGAQPQVYKRVRVTRVSRKVTREYRTRASARHASNHPCTRARNLASTRNETGEYSHRNSRVLAT